MDGQVDSATKLRRQEQIMLAQQKIAFDLARKRIGLSMRTGEKPPKAVPKAAPTPIAIARPPRTSAPNRSATPTALRPKNTTPADTT